jgi:hypothetical protein
MPKLENKDELIKFMGDHYDHNLKVANYLLVAHGAALVGCLSVLKDYASTPQLKGVGLFVILFGFGLLAAIVYYASLAFARAVVLNALMDNKTADEGTAKFLERANFLSLAISAGLMVIAIVCIIWRFSSL